MLSGLPGLAGREKRGDRPRDERVCDSEESAAVEGRRFRRSRLSESESEETVEGSASATKLASIAVAIRQGDLRSLWGDSGGRAAEGLMGTSKGFGSARPRIDWDRPASTLFSLGLTRPKLLFDFEERTAFTNVSTHPICRFSTENFNFAQLHGWQLSEPMLSSIG